MPRPGPRPYECVRRAWHSDRHQPIRGSLIQEIFRIANEIHSPTTKKKKEWQEKLPVVVLKAEEIMYSKANSEAEYMDLKTLGDRANDAINTIIRRDESSEETAEFLQPCIEAALHLGCIPRRASRSQRNNQSRGYLTGNPDLTNVTEGNSKLNSSLMPCYSNFLGKEPQNPVLPMKRCLHTEPFLLNPKGLPRQASFPPQSYAVYPLHYGACSQPIQRPSKLVNHSALESTYNDLPGSETSRKFPRCSEENLFCRADQPHVPIIPPVKECDLSLRLGFSSMQEDEDAHVNKMHSTGTKQAARGRSLLYEESKASSRDEILSLDFMARKRKTVDQMMDQRHSWEPKLLPTHSNKGTRTAG